ncbi:unnamed protein product [Cylicocyclus nassatus]|uniref:Uncharacterized protein n=1 Tax=Cylicocyclus nassatus TaxID=53992 RepID=A0AA36M6W2_CYLNA|nr:unnamed protein product [Cylicocyclus nassatus]
MRSRVLAQLQVTNTAVHGDAKIFTKNAHPFDQFSCVVLEPSFMAWLIYVCLITSAGGCAFSGARFQSLYALSCHPCAFPIQSVHVFNMFYSFSLLC